MFRRDPEAALKQRDLCIRPSSFFYDYAHDCDTTIAENPEQGRIQAGYVLRLAERWLGSCQSATAHGIVATSLRALGDMDGAEVAYRLAFELGEACGCVRCLPDLRRRLAFLRRDQKRFDDAFAEVNAALVIYREAENRDGMGRCRICRGQLYLELDRVAEAIRDFREALTLISIESSPTYHRWAFANFTVALARGADDDFALADELMPELRGLYRGVRGISAERAKLTWLEGSIKLRRGEDLPGLTLLLEARDQLTQLAMPLDVAAITADIAAVLAPDGMAIRDLVEETAICPPQLREPLKGVYRATRHGVSELLAAIGTLRDAATAAGAAPPVPAAT